ncbi:hypothetical protein GA0074695_3616 [Micromonospora viridifaciens]|uniref:SMI1 / KNR4 family (SUKH-1) n=1 Tax=Micromonospora viridifaciens TaxID=1881 RepID=A0A1C4XUI4_MICVI|nr:hypothetical protein [Micromonospora viridifaciens]SCF12072.1 hypothetical protein GA0074695_3616 [Micromonospora viridifaciens]
MVPPGEGLLPAAWLPIAEATDPATRRDAALGLWPGDLLAVLPRFAGALRDSLADVRVCLLDGVPALVYVFPGAYEPLITWVGHDFRSFGAEPRFWEHFPDALRVFLREVHAGFTSRGPEEFGVMRPDWMVTLADMAGMPEGIEAWDEVQEIASARLLVIGREGEQMLYCVSPDTEPGHLLEVYEGDVDPRPFPEVFDDLLALRFEVN